uniref:Pecanex-like protein n=1 Tax=Ascaris lumbricoides TaxID=6252 RepID=A0A9J2PCS3_ASCLU
MTVGTHAAEIARQGIWASLTGGWYYEPAYSVFCNVVHLYTWIVLFLLPLLLGIVCTSTNSLGLVLAYAGFIMLLFGALKFVVSYLHNLFDTTDPIPRAPKKPSKQVGGESSLSTSLRQMSSSVRSRDEGEIEMVEMNVVRTNEENAETTSNQDHRSSLRRRRIVRIDEVVGPVVDADLHSHKEGEEWDEDASSGHHSEHGLLPPTFATLLPADSLELLPIGVRRQSDVDARRRSAIVRKYSEPCLEGVYRGWGRTPRRRLSDAEPHVRRAKSAFETANRANMRSGTMLSQRTLEECKKITRKSYPSKMSSTAAFLSDALATRCEPSASDSVSFDVGGIPVSTNIHVDEIVSDNEALNSPCDAGPSKPFLEQLDDLPENIPSTSQVQIEENERKAEEEEKKEALVPIEVTTYTEQESDSKTAVPSSSGSGWTPVFVSLGDLDRPSTSALHRTSERIVGSDNLPIIGDGSDGMDLKGEITKFLEELIDKHPETLDAIESVRMNRLGRTSNAGLATGTSSVQRTSSSLQPRLAERSSTTVAALSDLAQRDGTHVAVDHEDTSQGAVHSFQDEDGNWWTYAFDSQGVGTAHALGSSRALLEMIQHNNATHPHTKLSALPENVSGSSEDSDVERTGGGCATQVCAPSRVPGGESRLRALSSSSTESGTYIADMPSAIFHASSCALVSRHLDRDRQVVSFVNVAARLRGAARRRSRGSVMRSEQFLEEQSAEGLGGLEPMRMLRGERQPRGSTASRAARTSTRGDSTSSSLHRIPFFSDITSMGMSSTSEPRRSSVVQKSYYYRLKVFPSKKGGKGIKLQMDRLSVAALFDRNNSLFSSLFDVFLAAAVAYLAGMLLSRSLFCDVSLVLFSIVVAGTHFSLLKSVQPDAASPIHGFNWLVAYSRPAFFCLLGVALLLIDGDWWDHRAAETVIGWEWNPYRIGTVPNASIIAAIRDLLSTLILLLPIAFTLGLLPQVNTLLLHILEQLEMHAFGGTACFSLLSAFLQLSKSLLAFAILCVLAHLAHREDATSTQNAVFSTFAAISVSLSYLLSRGSSNPAMMALTLKSFGLCSSCDSHEEVSEVGEEKNEEGAPPMRDTLPEELSRVVSNRFRHDILVSILVALIFFALHCTSMFAAAQPYLQIVLCGLCVLFGVMNHYLYMELRTATPWRLVARPILRAHEFAQFESAVAAKLMYFEVVHFYMLFIEKNVLYPLLVISTTSQNNWSLHPYFIALFSLRVLRSAFSQPQLLYIPLAFSFLLVHTDLSAYEHIEGYFPLILYLASILWPKALELALKLNFILAYVAPWQISWGSAFHAFAQPFSVPHTALVCVQTLISSIVSAPLNPFLGSSFFLTSYVRPVKFWEKDYNTRRVDHSNTRLISQIDRGPMMDDSNLNAVFYEHLTRSLQSSLAGDLLLGRWSTSVQPGDCFILASFYLNSLVHIIEVGNGFITFQLRGLEFRGTYCHQREVEAISEDVAEGVGCCCCSPGSLPGMLSLNTAWVLRWLAWEVVTAKYIVDGYSITDNSAVNLLQVHELRRLLVTLYVKCIIYYALSSSKLSQWLRTPTIVTALHPIESSSRYVDLDPMFGAANDEDFDINLMGVSRHNFTDLYETWIQHCIQQRAATDNPLSEEDGGMTRVTAFCFALSVVGRRALAAAAHNRHANAAESFLYGLHALFKGDFRITCQRDEWVFADMDLLRCVVAPGVRMALKLHQDHFTAGDDFDDVALLYDRITHHLSKLFISHEHDPAWRRAIIANTPSLLALRHMYDDGQDDYKIIMLNKMHLNMRVIELNRECVRAFWAGQQQELIFLRNRNPERGSIQNARQVLRNMINSSADQPIGYPIYVSPLTTSFVDTHPQIRSLMGAPLTPDLIYRALRRVWWSIRSHFGTSGSSSMPPVAQNTSSASGTGRSAPSDTVERQYMPVEQRERGSVADSASRESSSSNQPIAVEPSSSFVRAENSIVAMGADGIPKVALYRRLGKREGSGGASLEGSSSLSSPHSYEPPEQYAKIIDTEQVFKCLDEPLKATGEPLVVWPHARWRMRGGRSSWDWMPCEGYKGQVVHKWVPFHPKKERRSHAGVIYLLYVKEMGGCYVPVGEPGVELISKEEYEAGDTEISLEDALEEAICGERLSPEECARTIPQGPHTAL